MTLTDQPQTSPDPLELRHELNAINLLLRRHNDGEALLPDADYRAKLRRSIEIVTSLNFTTVGPKEKKSKSRLPVGNPSSLDDL